LTPVFQKLEALEENRRPFGTQLFPFRTMAMILSFISLVIVSRIMVWLFRTGRLRKDQDYFMCIVNIDDNGSDAPPYDEDGETIGMTTNADVKTYKAVEEVQRRSGSSEKLRRNSSGRKVEGARGAAVVSPEQEKPGLKNGERARLSSSGRAGSIRERPPAIDPMVDRPFKRKPSLAKQMSKTVMSPDGLPQKSGAVEKQSSVTSPGDVTLEETPGAAQSSTRKIQPLRKGDRKESLKQIKQGIKVNVKNLSTSFSNMGRMMEKERCSLDCNLHRAGGRDGGEGGVEGRSGAPAGRPQGFHSLHGGEAALQAARQAGEDEAN